MLCIFRLCEFHIQGKLVQPILLKPDKKCVGKLTRVGRMGIIFKTFSSVFLCIIYRVSCRKAC